MKNLFLIVLIALSALIALFADLPDNNLLCYCVFGNILGGLTSSIGNLGSTIGNAFTGAIGNLTGGLFNNLFGTGGSSEEEIMERQQEYNWRAMMQQFANQLQLNKQSQGWSTSMAYRQNQWAKEMFERMSKFQQEQWDYQFNKQANYNSPANQVRMLQSAGFNPSVLLANGNNVGSVSGSSVSAPNGGVGSFPGASAGSAAMAHPLPLESLVGLQEAQRMGSLAEASKTLNMLPLEKEEKVGTINEIRERIKNIIEDTDLKKIQQVSIDLENWIKRDFTPKEIAARIKNLNQQADLFVLQGDVAQAETFLKKAQKLVADEEYQYFKTRNSYASQLFEHQVLLVKQQVETEKAKQKDLAASAGEHAAGAGLRKAETETENALRDGRVRAQELANDLKDNEVRFSTATFVNRCQQVFENLQLTRENLKRLGIENFDNASYNALQRIINGHYQTGDEKLVRQMLQNMIIEK